MQVGKRNLACYRVLYAGKQHAGNPKRGGYNAGCISRVEAFREDTHLQDSRYLAAKRGRNP